MDRFYSYNPDTGYDTHATEEEAKNAALRALDDYRDDSTDEGWSEDVEHVAWGEIREHVTETKRRTVEDCEREGDEHEAQRLRDNGWDYTADYGLVPVEQPAAVVVGVDVPK